MLAVMPITLVRTSGQETSVTWITAAPGQTFHYSLQNVCPSLQSHPETKWMHWRINMDRNIDWPWSWEEEIEWKADLEDRDNNFLEDLIDNALEDNGSVSGYLLESLPQELSEDASSDKYCVMA